MFDTGDWVIDTQKKTAPEVCAVIPNSYPTIYVLFDDENGSYYVQSEENLMPYNKHWFEDNCRGDGNV